MKLTSRWLSAADHPKPGWVDYTYTRVAKERAPLLDAAKHAVVIYTAKVVVPSSVKLTGTFFGARGPHDAARRREGRGDRAHRARPTRLVVTTRARHQA
jgi:hypothetical protein